MKTCGFCEKSCGNDWCPVLNGKVNDFPEKNKDFGCDFKGLLSKLYNDIVIIKTVTFAKDKTRAINEIQKFTKHILEDEEIKNILEIE